MAPKHSTPTKTPTKKAKLEAQAQQIEELGKNIDLLAGKILGENTTMTNTNLIEKAKKLQGSFATLEAEHDKMMRIFNENNKNVTMNNINNINISKVETDYSSLLEEFKEEFKVARRVSYGERGELTDGEKTKSNEKFTRGLEEEDSDNFTREYLDKLKREKPELTENEKTKLNEVFKKRQEEEYLAYLAKSEEIKSKTGLSFVKINDDGHCFYNAIALCVGQSVKNLRNSVANHLRQNKGSYIDVLTFNCSDASKDNADDYINEIEFGTEWATDLEITILMKILTRPIYVVRADNYTIANAINAKDHYAGEPIFVLYTQHEDQRRDKGRNKGRDIGHYDGLSVPKGSNAREIANRLLKTPPVPVLPPYTPLYNFFPSSTTDFFNKHQLPPPPAPSSATAPKKPRMQM